MALKLNPVETWSCFCPNENAPLVIPDGAAPNELALPELALLEEVLEENENALVPELPKLGVDPNPLVLDSVRDPNDGNDACELDAGAPNAEEVGPDPNEELGVADPKVGPEEPNEKLLILFVGPLVIGLADVPKEKVLLFSAGLLVLGLAEVLNANALLLSVDPLVLEFIEAPKENPLLLLVGELKENAPLFSFDPLVF